MNHMLFVHGRSFKPSSQQLEGLWYDAIRHGLKSDYGSRSVDAFNRAKKSFIYYGNLSNDLLAAKEGTSPDLEVLAKMRKQTLGELMALERSDFADSSVYSEIMRKRNRLRSRFIRYVSRTIRLFHKEDAAARVVAARKEDLEEFWDSSGPFGQAVRDLLTKALKPAIAAGDRVLILSHSLGTIIAYDCLWHLSQGSKTDRDGRKAVDSWVTLGSPLGDSVVKSQLFGADKNGPSKYPSNIREWTNVAAKHDYIAADKDVGDDYRNIANLGTIIIDKRIFNLAQRDGESHPHSSLGYLIHPVVSTVLHNWLTTA